MGKELCPYCGKQLGPDGNCYNQDCEWYDPVSQYDTAEIERQVMRESKNNTCTNYATNKEG